MDYGRQLTVMRAVRGMSQLELARVTGIPNYLISRMETGVVLPAPETDSRIHQALRWPARAEAAFVILEGEDAA